MLSIWERNSFLHYDHIIIGSGIVGLTAAWYLRQKFPGRTVLVLERGLMPSGASTKNAGFACMGSVTELLDDLDSAGPDEVCSLFLLRKKGLERLQGLLGKENIGYRTNGSYELLFEHDAGVLNDINRLNALLFPELGTQAFAVCNEKIEAFGFETKKVKALIENRCEGEIDTGLMMKNLIMKVISAGVEIKTGCRVTAFFETGSSVDVVCKDPVSGKDLIFNAGKLLICNNAFAKALLPAEDVVPGRGQVLITRPVPGLKFKGIFHFDRGYYYFREYQGCVLFGGGRNMDTETETSTLFSLNETIQADLKQKLHEMILPGQAVEIDMQWSGIMAFGQHKRPILKQHSPNTWVGVRMGGMGIAIGSEIGFQLSERV